MSADTSSPSHRKGTVDLIALLDMVWRARRLVCMIAGGLFVLGVAYAVLATPIYQSDLLVQIESNSDSAGTQLLGSISDYLGVKSTDDAEMQILRSRRVVGAAVDQTHYDIVAEPRRFPLVGRYFRGQGQLAPGWLGIGGYAWGTESMEVSRFDVPDALYGETFLIRVLSPERYDIASSHLASHLRGEFGKSMRVPTDAGDAILHIDSVRARPGTAFELTRYSHQQTISQLQQRLAIIDKAKDAGVITVSLESPHPQRVARLLNALGNAYVQLNSEQKAEQAQKSLDFLGQQLPGLKQDLQHAEDALLQYRNRHGAIDLGESAKLQLGQQVALQTRISQLLQERQGKLEQFMPKHPDVLAIDAQVGALKRELQALDQQLMTLPETEQAVVRLTRDVRVNTDLYVAMLNSMQQLRLLRAGKVGNVRVVDHAEVQELPIKPRRLLVILGSLVLGLFAGVATALLRALWRGSVTDPREIEGLLDVPVAAAVPQNRPSAPWSPLRRLRNDPPARWPLAATRPHEAAVESLQGLAIAIQLHLMEARNPIVLVTSATPNMGKTFISANLAVLMANTGRRVLLVDGDLRRGSLQEQFQLPPGAGMVDVLSGRATLDHAICPSGLDGLDLLRNGGPAANPTSLLQSGVVDACMAEWATRYDMVIVDTAPLLPVVDTLLLARRAGSVYAVARYGVTSEGELLEVRSRLSRAGIPLAGIVLNGVEGGLQGSIYATYGYGHAVSPESRHKEMA